MRVGCSTAAHHTLDPHLCPRFRPNLAKFATSELGFLDKKVTGPLPNFKRMIKGDSYQMMLDHLSHTITELGSNDNWAQFEVIILDKDKIYHKFNWQVEKYTLDGLLKDCWLTTMVSNPIPLGSSI